jgi:2-oxoglutarate dehydrogenase E1 component
VPEVLELGHFGLSDADLDTEFYTGSRTSAIAKRMKLRDIIAQLRHIYCGTIGAEFAHVSDSKERLWLQDRFQAGRVQNRFSTEERKTFLRHLTAAEGLERYLATKYPAQKRFSLEGGDALIPLLDDLIQQGGQRGIEEIVIGMAHRGRLNVLVNVVGKSPQQLFSEFEGKYDANHMRGSGDVKYHKGFSTDIRTPAGNVHVALAFNPSHLEVVDPVVEGSVRARQQRCNDAKGDKVAPLLIHGDAAFAGQGVVAECFGLTDLKGYRTGGSLHFIVNNQIGFTTYPRYSRSSPYPSDVAKMIEALIFHVNGDDPEAVVFAAKVATEYRQKFQKPVVIDMFCYRRFGHNEGDEPSFTQPLMYKKIRAHPTTLEIYSRKLVGEGVVAEGEVEKMKADWRTRLDAEFEAGQGYKPNKADWLDGRWSGMKAARDADDPRRGNTGVDAAELRDIGRKITAVPQGFTVHRTIQRFLEHRAKAIESGEGIDWATGEALALCSLLKDGHPVRLSGQDSERGTFSQRHSVLFDQNTEERHTPFNHLGDPQARF